MNGLQTQFVEISIKVDHAGESGGGGQTKEGGAVGEEVCVP